MRKNRRRNFIYLWIALFGIALGSTGWKVQDIRASIPDELYVVEDDSNVLKELEMNPWVTTSETVETISSGKYLITCKLFDTFTIKQVAVSQAEPIQVGVCGDTVGIYMETDGVLVIDTQPIMNSQSIEEEPARTLIQAGDYVQKVNGQDVSKKDDFVTAIKDNQGEPVVLQINRNGATHEVSIQPVHTQDGSYKLGLWIRDNTQGIGTLTYVTEDGHYGALGHGISDSDMGQLLKLKQGDLYNAQVVSVTKGASGNPGELAGIIRYDEEEHLGTIDENNPCGIYGNVDQSCLSLLDLRWIEMAYKQEIQVGDATILCSVDDQVEEYKVRIEEIYWDAAKTNKAFVIQVTDERLLEQTGGIVQGMSGAPVIQNGKMVGAVTHVLVNDPTRGYGIFAETMVGI